MYKLRESKDYYNSVNYAEILGIFHNVFPRQPFPFRQLFRNCLISNIGDCYFLGLR